MYVYERSDMSLSGRASVVLDIASGLKWCTELQSPNSILFYYSSEKKCKQPEEWTESEAENAEMTEETPEFHLQH